MVESKVTLPEEAVQGLRASVNGEVLTPNDPGYEEARHLWNGMIDKQPAIIVRPRGVADVIDAVNFARENNLPVAVRGGGHNVAGNAMSDGGVTIDLSEMNSVRVDPATRTVRAEGGARLGDLDRETQAFGLAVPAGVVSDTGLAGLALGGGLGWMRRKYGPTSDNLISADVVTADGRLVTASARDNADLFWALRGGGGGHGVVTSFELQAYPLGPEIFFCAVFYSLADAADVMKAFREFHATSPDEVNVVVVFGTIPDVEPFPAEVHGERFIAFVGGYAGAADEGERVVNPLRTLAKPLADLSGAIPYVEAQKFFDEDYPSGRRYYWKSQYLKELSGEAIEAMIGHAATYPSPLTTIDLWPQGGAIARPSEDTAFAHRDAPFLLNFESNWDDPADDEANVSWTRAAWNDMDQFSTGGLYVNFPGFEEGGEAHRRSAYGAAWERLQEIKRRYDPTNLFRPG